MCYSRKTEFEIELKSRQVWGRVAVLIHESESELNDLQQIDVAAEQLVLVVGCRSKLSDRAGNDTYTEFRHYLLRTTFTGSFTHLETPCPSRRSSIW
jgi:hypothetical protein